MLATAVAAFRQLLLSGEGFDVWWRFERRAVGGKRCGQAENNPFQASRCRRNKPLVAPSAEAYFLTSNYAPTLFGECHTNLVMGQAIIIERGGIDYAAWGIRKQW
ncbi:MAG: hypothetical protein ABI268_04770 [Rhodanobacter sp.]